MEVFRRRLPLDSLAEELKTLPPQQLELAAHYIHQLKGTDSVHRRAMVAQTGGYLTTEEADEFERIIHEGYSEHLPSLVSRDTFLPRKDFICPNADT